MANPWDPQPIPESGDDNEETTYGGVGRVISAWSYIEFSLSRLYTLFLGDLDAKDPMNEFGAYSIFRERFNALDRAACTYFARHPSQAGEAIFDQLTEHIVGYSDRRNEVAHGIVMDMKGLRIFEHDFSQDSEGRAQFLVIPPLHMGKKHVRSVPTYAYNRAMLDDLAGALNQILVLTDRYMKGLFLREGQA